jgi:hypothetical protein
MQVHRDDFLLALDEVHAAFGVSESELQQVVQNGIIHFDPKIDVSLRFSPLTTLNTSRKLTPLRSPFIVFSSVDSQRRQPLRRASPQIPTNPARLRPPTRPLRLWQDRPRRDHRPLVLLPLHQDDLAREHGRLRRGPEGRLPQQGLHRFVQVAVERRCRG